MGGKTGRAFDWDGSDGAGRVGRVWEGDPWAAGFSFIPQWATGGPGGRYTTCSCVPRRADRVERNNLSGKTCAKRGVIQSMFLSFYQF